VIAQCQEIWLFKNGQLVIPEKPGKKSDIENLALDDLDPIVLLKEGAILYRSILIQARSPLIFTRHILKNIKKIYLVRHLKE
jgi:hypothetical protein